MIKRTTLNPREYSKITSYLLRQEWTTRYTTRATLRVLIVRSGERERGCGQACLEEMCQEREWGGVSAFKGCSARAYGGLRSYATNAHRLHGHTVHGHRLHKALGWSDFFPERWWLSAQPWDTRNAGNDDKVCSFFLSSLSWRFCCCCLFNF